MFTFIEIGDNPQHVKEVVKGTIKLYWNQSPLYLDYMKYFTLDELSHIKIADLSKDHVNSYKEQALKSNELSIDPFVQVNHNNMGIYLFKGIFNEYGKPIQITFYLLLSLSFGLFILFGIFMYVLFQSRKKELAYAMELELQK